MILCIAEKPSVARELARIVGATSRQEGFLEGNGYLVTWTYGHLCTLKDPEDYHTWWRQWDLRDLPLIPKRFGIKPIEVEGYQRQLRVIRSLLARATSVINCGDAGQEGELIQQWVLQHCECNLPIKRLWVSSLTDEAIREGFEKLRSNEELQPLYYAGLARAIGDWLLGINATRLYTTKYRSYTAPKQPLSVGRVQTPTLALIVERQHEIDHFQPSTTYEIRTIYRGVTFRQAEEAFKTEEEARKTLDELAEKPFEITKVERKKGRDFPPKLFDLTALQVEANRRYKMSAEETLQAIQSLYEKKLTTYPRVDTNYLPDDLWPKMPAIITALGKQDALKEYVQYLIEGKKLEKAKRIFDNKKVTDHHAIIPTGVEPASTLTPHERTIYDLVARRLLAAFYPAATFATTAVEGLVEGFPFKASGKQLLEAGWRLVYKPEEEKEGEQEDTNLESSANEMPSFKKGESGSHQPEVKQKVSQPPKYYTEATLLRTMETAGKLVEDETLRDMLKQNGIGRPSTRAAIIETLFKRGYIKKVGNSLRATERGITLISLIKEPMLKSVELTGEWEYKLRAIERKEYDAGRFIAELKEQILRIVKEEL